MSQTTLQRYEIRPAVLDECTMIIAPAADGEYVLHADALAAIEAAREEERARWQPLLEWLDWLDGQPSGTVSILAVQDKLRSMGVL